MVKGSATCRQLVNAGAIATPDPDIAGVGVIIAFLLSAYITFIAVLAAYVFGLLDGGLLRPVDRLILRVPSRASKYPRWHRTLRKAVLALSDQQIVTGIAILGAGFQGLRTGKISVYHYQIVVYLAWLSSSVHLSALTLLRPFFYYHRGVMVWRFIGMAVLLVMLLVALVPTVSNDWDIVTTGPQTPGNETLMGIPAICFWGDTWGDGVNPDAILSFLLILVSYIWKMGGMFMPPRKLWQHCFRSPVDGLSERLLSAVAKQYEVHGGHHWLWAFRFSLAAFLPLTAFLEVLGSLSAILWLSVIGLLYGTLQVVVPRSIIQDITPGLASQENQITFGQLVPLILLIQPLGAATEHIWLRKSEDEAVYDDYGGEDPYSNDLGSYQDGKNLVGLPDQPLLQFMASYTPLPWTAPGPQRTQLRALLYSSWAFTFVVYSVHAAIAAVAVIILYWDYHTIGYSTLGAYNVVYFAISGWFGGFPIIVLCLLPFSRLGRYWKRERRSSMLPRDVRQSFSGSVRNHTVEHSQSKSRTTSPSPPSAPTSPSSIEMHRTDWSRNTKNDSRTQEPQQVSQPASPPRISNGQRSPWDAV